MVINQEGQAEIFQLRNKFENIYLIIWIFEDLRYELLPIDGIYWLQDICNSFVTILHMNATENHYTRIYADYRKGSFTLCETKREREFLPPANSLNWSLSLFNMNIKLDLTHLEAMWLSPSGQHKRTLTMQSNNDDKKCLRIILIKKLDSYFTEINWLQWLQLF